MQGKKLLALALGISSTCLLSQAYAMMSLPMGWYLEANIGSSRISNVNYPGTVSSSGWGGNVDLGYKFMPYLTGEIGYTRYAGSTITNNLDQKAATITNYSYDLAMKGILPIVDSGFELFAKLGAARTSTNMKIQNGNVAASIGLGKSDHSATNVYLAIGGQYYFMPEFAANVQWARAKGNNHTGMMDLFSVGASFIFE